MKTTLNKLGREISYILRHNPKKYDLSLDEEGYVLIDELILKLKSNEKFNGINKDDLIALLNIDNNKRYVVKNNMIKASYGHSISINKNDVVIPPDILYHGTTKEAYSSIVNNGINSMKRGYVHLASNINEAIRVGKRRTNIPYILEIDAKRAYLDGVIFYKGNDEIYLTKYIDEKYISLYEIKEVFVVCAVIYDNDKILCVKRPANKSLPLCYEFPGGKIEKGETKEDAIIREIKEELLVDIEVDNYLGCVSYMYEERVNTKPFIVHLNVFKAHIVSGDVTLTEHVDKKYVTKKELVKLPFAKADIEIFKLL